MIDKYFEFSLPVSAFEDIDQDKLMFKIIKIEDEN